MRALVGSPGYAISSDPVRMDLAVIHGYLTRSYWSPGIPTETVARALRHSLCFGAFETDSGRQVGFARVVTDHATFAYLCDVFVLEQHRGRGLAQAMLAEAVAHPALREARRVMLATRDAHELYRRQGFVEVGQSSTLMQILRQNLYA